MNEKDFVTFEQAKKLKELGFNWECLYNYDDCGLQPNGCAYNSPDVDSSWESNNSKEYDPLGWIDAPFLYQVQNWLREEKNIHITIDTYYPGWNDGDYSITKYCFWCNLLDGTGKIIDPDDVYDSYHEALSAAIDYGLQKVVC